MGKIYDEDGDEVKEGDVVSFSYGLPPVHVDAPIRQRNGELWAITTGHNPNKCLLAELDQYVGGFYIKKD